MESMIFPYLISWANTIYFDWILNSSHAIDKSSHADFSELLLLPYMLEFYILLVARLSIGQHQALCEDDEMSLKLREIKHVWREVHIPNGK